MTWYSTAPPLGAFRKVSTSACSFAGSASTMKLNIVPSMIEAGHSGTTSPWPRSETYVGNVAMEPP